LHKWDTGGTPSQTMELQEMGVDCNGVFYHVVSFLIPNPQHTVSLYTFTYQESAWSGRSGLSLREYPEIIFPI
jgi:hypothetical protein